MPEPDAPPQHRNTIGWLFFRQLVAVSAAACLVLGLTRPMVILYVQVHQDPVVNELGNQLLPLVTGTPNPLRPQPKSILIGIADLVAQGGLKNLSAAGLLFGLGLVFPASKLVYRWTSAFPELGQAAGRLLPRTTAWAESRGILSFIDPLVVAVTVLTLAEFPGGSHVDFGSGFWLYLSFVFMVGYLWTWLE